MTEAPYLPPVWVVVTAAGSGQRLGADMPKALVPVGGKPILAHAINSVRSLPQVAGIVITCPAGQEKIFRDTVAEAQPFTSDTSPPDTPILWVAGGASRQASVYAGLQAIVQYQTEHADEGDPIVLIHDAARCLTPASVFHRVAMSVAHTGEATIAAVPVTDTLKQVQADSTTQAHVVRTIDRTTMRAVQTPQGFYLSHIVGLHEAAQARGADENSAATDDAGLAEQAGDPVRVVEGSALGMKITTAADIRYAAYLLDSECADSMSESHTPPK